jgi:hypothetical protein
MHSRNFFLTILSLLASSVSLLGQQPQYRPVTEEQKQLMDAALPGKAPAQPAKPRKLLVSNLCLRDGKVVRGHPSIPMGNYVIDQMGKKTGAYEVVFSDDVEMFRPGKIGQFDAICFNNTAGVLTDDSELRQSLLDFIARGGGFVGFHAAGATFVQHPRYDQFPEFGRMLGGTENGGHPWGPDEPFAVKIDDAANPINAAFGGRGFEVSDEAYQLQEPSPRERLHVLLSIDTAKSSIEGRRILPIRQGDQDFPVSWIKPHGQGRVFFTTLGHNPHIFWDAKLLQHFLAGMQYALGDLKADDTPDVKPSRSASR